MQPASIAGMFEPLFQKINELGAWAPWLHLLLFVDGSVLMLWRQEVLSRRGFEGTVLGALVMPYCSGLGNLLFVMIMIPRDGGQAVMVNCLVNNFTNLTLLLGLPALLWGLCLVPRDKAPKVEVRNGRMSRLSVLLTLIAAIFFTGAVWALGQDGELNRGDGIVLVGLFLFWQVFHVYEVLRDNVRDKRVHFGSGLLLDGVLLLAGALLTYVSVEGMVRWMTSRNSGGLTAQTLGWVTGWLMVMPNAVLALYYGWRRRANIVYSSQAGDGHICLPLCVGLYCLFRPLPTSGFNQPALILILVAATIHGLLLITRGGLPRVIGGLLVVVYGGWVFWGFGR